MDRQEAEPGVIGNYRFRYCYRIFLEASPVCSMAISTGWFQQFLPTLFASSPDRRAQVFLRRVSPQLSWYFVVMNHLWIALAISFYEEVTTRKIAIYISGILISGLVEYACLAQLKSLERTVDMKDPQGQGHVYEYPGQAFIFLIACLGLMGFPITPSFLGIDLIFTHTTRIRSCCGILALSSS